MYVEIKYQANQDTNNTPHDQLENQHWDYWISRLGKQPTMSATMTVMRPMYSSWIFAY